jgi:2-dehydro-3-deoxygluconokinase
MVDLVTFGETMLRLSPPGGDRIERADQFDCHVAGAESNVATAASRLGLDAVWLSKLPDSPLGRKVTSTLAGYGVDTDVVWSDTGRQGTYYVEMGGRPRGTDVIYDRADAAVTTATAAELPTGHVEAASAFHTTGITPALSETLEETTADLLALARANDTTTVFDANYRSKLWSVDRARETMEALFPDVDVLVVAERDAAEVLGRDGAPADVATELTAAFDFDLTVITRGGDGVVAVQDGRVYEQGTFAADDLDPVGTGDAFVGGFLSQWVAGGSVPESLEYGAATAALKRTIPGDVALVTPGEVDGVIASDAGGISR